jgi:alkylation response protein AidB-like acyl-CoA dehydrogenase
MTADDLPSPEALLVEYQGFLGEHWDPGLSVGDWWDLLVEHRWAAVTWPSAWFGRDATARLARLLAEERERRHIPGGPGGLGVLLAGPTILTHGTEEQKRRFLRPILTGEAAWCQLFSEPGAGSDLAGLQTRAVRDGDEWVVSGQKTWSSGAQIADVGMLIARTDVDVPKHQGITYFAISMDQPGVEVRPIKEMTGLARFSEVFLDGARVPAGNEIGEVNGGWRVAQTTLANERTGLAGGSEAVGGATPGGKRGVRSRRAGDLVTTPRAPGGSNSAVFSTRGFRLLARLAQENGRGQDAAIRQDLASLFVLEEIRRYTAMRAKAAVQSGRSPGPEVSTQKLGMSRAVRASRDLGMAILGARGLAHDETSAAATAVQEMFLMSPAPSIYGGTDQIQRNIIGERVLGLPRETADDSVVPFRQRNTG